MHVRRVVASTETARKLGLFNHYDLFNRRPLRKTRITGHCLFRGRKQTHYIGETVSGKSMNPIYISIKSRSP